VGFDGELKPRVLVVDDEPVVLGVTARMLDSIGYPVSTAGSAREALRLLEIGDPAVHLILTDVVMPETDGRMLGRLVAEKHPAIPVFYMSAYPRDDVFHRGGPGPDLTFIRKPFSHEQLVVAIQSLLAKPVAS
jgi:CheY-like chemotaxis protein